MIPERNKLSKITDFAKIVASFAVAMILSVVSLPESIAVFRPDFVVLMLIFWCLYKPQSVGIFTAFVVGLLADTILFGVLGQNAIAKVTVAYIVLRLMSTAVSATLWKQTLVILVLLYLNAWIISIVNKFTQGYAGSISLWLAPLTGALIWYLFVFFWRTREKQHGFIE